MLRDRLHPLWRQIAHAVLLLAGWAVFFGFWWKVLRRPVSFDPLFVVIPLIIIVVPTVTFYWILHNVHLYRRRDARRSAAGAPERYDRDWYGRQVMADWEKLRGAHDIVVEVTGDNKRYEALE